MQKKRVILFPRHRKLMEELGRHIRLARKRRRYTTIQTAERAGIDRTTLYKIEKGDPSVAFGSYFNVLRVLGLHENILNLAGEDPFGRELQDIGLLRGVK